MQFRQIDSTKPVKDKSLYLHRAYRFQFYPAADQLQLINQTLGNARFIYNYGLRQKISWWEANKDLPSKDRDKAPSFFELSSRLSQLKLDCFSIDSIGDLDPMTLTAQDLEPFKNYWLKAGLSTALQQSLTHLETAYKNFFSNIKKGKVGKAAGFPQFKTKHQTNKFTITQNNWRYSSSEVTDKKGNKKVKHNFVLSHTQTPLNIKFDKRVIDPSKITKLTITKTASGKYFITFLIEQLRSDYLTEKQTARTAKQNKTTPIQTSWSWGKTTYTEPRLGKKNKKKDKNKTVPETKNISTSIQQNNSIQIVENKNLTNVEIDKDKSVPQVNTSLKVPLTKKTVGIDLGIKTTLTYCDKTTNVIVEKSLNNFKKYNKRVKRLSKALSRKTKGGGNRINSVGHNREKARLKLARHHEKLTNYITDFYHKETTKLVEENDIIILETLNILGMVKNHKLARSIQQRAWGKFCSQIEYKANWNNKTVIRADQFFPSSKICSHCQHYNSNYGKLIDKNKVGLVKKKSIQIPDKWTCSECATTHQRDENAARNLANYEALKDTYKTIMLVSLNKDMLKLNLISQEDLDYITEQKSVKAKTKKQLRTKAVNVKKSSNPRDSTAEKVETGLVLETVLIESLVRVGKTSEDEQSSKLAVLNDQENTSHQDLNL